MKIEDLYPTDEELSQIIQSRVTGWYPAPPEFIEDIGRVSAKYAVNNAVKKIVEWAAKVNKVAWYTERYPRDYGCNIGPRDWQELQELNK